MKRQTLRFLRREEKYEIEDLALFEAEATLPTEDVDVFNNPFDSLEYREAWREFLVYTGHQNIREPKWFGLDVVRLTSGVTQEELRLWDWFASTQRITEGTVDSVMKIWAALRVNVGVVPLETIRLLAWDLYPDLVPSPWMGDEETTLWLKEWQDDILRFLEIESFLDLPAMEQLYLLRLWSRVLQDLGDGVRRTVSDLVRGTQALWDEHGYDPEPYEVLKLLREAPREYAMYVANKDKKFWEEAVTNTGWEKRLSYPRLIDIHGKSLVKVLERSFQHTCGVLEPDLRMLDYQQVEILRKSYPSVQNFDILGFREVFGRSAWKALKLVCDRGLDPHALTKTLTVCTRERRPLWSPRASDELLQRLNLWPYDVVCWLVANWIDEWETNCPSLNRCLRLREGFRDVWVAAGRSHGFASHQKAQWIEEFPTVEIEENVFLGLMTGSVEDLGVCNVAGILTECCQQDGGHGHRAWHATMTSPHHTVLAILITDTEDETTCLAGQSMVWWSEASQAIVVDSWEWAGDNTPERKERFRRCLEAFVDMLPEDIDVISGGPDSTSLPVAPKPKDAVYDYDLNLGCGWFRKGGVRQW